MPSNPQRIVLILPCCIGDVVLATATLATLKRAYPQAHITWVASTWVLPILQGHPMIDDFLVTGDSHLPLYRLREFVAFVRGLRAGAFDIAVSLVRSPLMSLALWLSGIPIRAGLDSGGRGFGYSHKAPLHPHEALHEMDVYLRVVQALSIATDGALPVAPYDEAQLTQAFATLEPRLPARYVVANPAGGVNPGMMLVSKRYPPAMLAQLLAHAVAEWGVQVVLVGGKGDEALVSEVAQACRAEGFTPHVMDKLTLLELCALAARARAYFGNDTGLTHLVAAVGAPTVMLMGLTDPARYAPRGVRVLAIRKENAPAPRAVSEKLGAWDWARDGITPAEAWARVQAWIT